MVAIQIYSQDTDIGRCCGIAPAACLKALLRHLGGSDQGNWVRHLLMQTFQSAGIS
jgi:hypothetical protein